MPSDQSSLPTAVEVQKRAPGRVRVVFHHGDHAQIWESLTTAQAVKLSCDLEDVVGEMVEEGTAHVDILKVTRGEV